MDNRAWIEIDIGQVKKNINKIKEFTGRKFMACVKANCYGLGVKPISKNIEEIVDYFGVATVEEGIELRETGIKKPILILGTILPKDVKDAIGNDILITLCNREILKEISKVAEKIKKVVKVHIKIDTGMGRIGVLPEKATDFIEEVIKDKKIFIEGIFTHLATAEWKDKKYAEKQIEKFKEVLQKIEKKVTIPLKHIANSASILNLPQTYKEFDIVRIGLLLLGVYPEKYLYKNLPLKCALSGYSRILFIKEVPKNTYLSYGISFVTKKRTKVATIGIGYADGLKRALSNKFYLKYNGRKVKIIGNICMDQTLLDITGEKAKIGDKIKIFGNNFEIEEMAEIVKTVPQEILCGFGSKRVNKIYK